MTRAEASKLVTDAIEKLIEREAALLDLGVAERALAHQLAQYMSELVASHLSVDCEYNRHFRDSKKLRLPSRKASGQNGRKTTVFPDILVHRRNTDEFNLIALELKKPGEDIAYDELKLRAFREELGYLHTGHVILGVVSGTVIRDVVWID